MLGTLHNLYRAGLERKRKEEISHPLQSKEFGVRCRRRVTLRNSRESTEVAKNTQVLAR